MRKHAHAELGGHQQDGEVLVNPVYPCGVDLNQVHRLCLQQLLENDAVMRVLTGGHRHGNRYLIADGAPREPAASDVVVQIRAHLKLDGAEALLHRLLGQRHALLVRVAEPARGGCVGRIATSLHLGNPAGLAVLRLAQQAIYEVNQRFETLR